MNNDFEFQTACIESLLNIEQALRYLIDGMVVDGPHGNGRSLAFPLFFECLKLKAWILIDDVDHYSFMDDLSKIFRFKIVKKELPSNDKRWVLLRLEGKI